MAKLRIVFMGTPEIAVPALRSLSEAGHVIAAVYCQPPKPSGRGQTLHKSPVQIEAERLGLAVRAPKTLRDADEQRFLKNLNLDAIVVVAYGLILPLPVLDAPRLGCLNIHFSLLPRWRGAAPVQHAILAGDKETGVCIMQMAAGLDTGDILLSETVPIAPSATTGSLLPELAVLGAAMTLRALEGRANGALTPRPQAKDGVTLAPRFARSDGLIDWEKPAVVIERQVRALSPWPGTFFQFSGEKIKVLEAQLVPVQIGKPGRLLDDAFTIACGEQALRLVKVQRAGKKATDGSSLLRGLRLPEGHSFV